MLSWHLKKFGELNRLKGEINNAIAAYKGILHVISTKLGQHHISVVSIFNIIRSLYFENSRFQKGLKMYERSRFVLEETKHSQKLSDTTDFKNTITTIFGKCIISKPIAAPTA